MGSTTMRVITVLLVGILALMVALREARINRHKLREYQLKMANLIYQSTKEEVGLSMPTIEVQQPTCVAKEFNYTVHRKRCASQTIKNKFCYGLCDSFYVPGDKVNTMYSRCVPTVTQQEVVYLTCFKKRALQDSRESGDSRFMVKSKPVIVMKVLHCGCERQKK